LVVVDYAHTPDAITQALAALRSQAKLRGGRLWCVLGCGGDRDASKRPLMAAAAEAAADQVVLTSDNPRSESPEAILAAMVQGLSQPHRQLTNRPCLGHCRSVWPKLTRKMWCWWLEKAMKPNKRSWACATRFRMWRRSAWLCSKSLPSARGLA
jgi:hypothetical protein